MSAADVELAAIALDCPYPGLRSFTSDESHLFFGREEQVDRLLLKLDPAPGRPRFLAVVGSSGCGKSSLVRAGLVAALETGFLSRAGATWRVATMRPGDRPTRNLAEALVHPDALGPGPEGDAAGALVLATLRRGPLGLAEVLSEPGPGGGRRLPEGENLLLIVDQFEELFRFRREGDPNEADAFVALLLTTADPEVKLPVYVVLTMRSDFLGDCALFRGLPEAVSDSQFLTPRLTREQRRAAIERPARVLGGQVDPTLVGLMLNEMGPGPDQLPLMQHALMRLWTYRQRPAGEPVVLTPEDYASEAIGGLEHAFSRHANAVFATLDEDQKSIAECLFRRLSGGDAERGDTRRPTRLKEIAEVAGVDPARATEVVEVFRAPGVNFVTPAQCPLEPETVLDISHESLIRQWDLLRQWTEAEAKSAETYRRIEQSARFWRDKRAALWTDPDLQGAITWREAEHPNAPWARRYGQDFELAMEFLDASREERRREQERAEAARRREATLKRTRLAAALATAAFLVALALVGWALSERTKAISAERKAEINKTIAERNAGKALTSEKQAVEQKILATRQTALATSLLLATRAQNLAKGDPIRGILLASEAIQTVRRENEQIRKENENARRAGEKATKAEQPDNVEAENVLRRTLGQCGGNGIVTNHSNMQGLAYSPDGKTIAAGYGSFGDNEKGGVVLWDVATRNGLGDGPLPGSEGNMSSVAFSPDGKTLAAGYYGSSGGVVLWDVATRKRMGDGPLPGSKGSVWSVAFSHDGKTLAAGYAGSSDGGVVLWDVATRKGLGDGPLRVSEGGVSSVAFSPDGKTLAGGYGVRDSRGGVVLFDATVRTRLQAQPLDVTEIEVQSVAFSPDGKTLAAGYGRANGDRGGVVLWDMTRRARFQDQSLNVTDRAVWSVAFSPDGKTLAAGYGRASGSGGVVLWDTERRTRRGGPIVMPEGDVCAVAFSPDGGRLVSGGEGGAARIWDLTSRTPGIAEPEVIDESSDTETAAASSDGRWVVVAGEIDVRLHDLTSNASAPISLDASRLLVGTEARRTGLRAAFSMDGRWLALASEKAIGFWDLPSKLAAAPRVVLSGGVRLMTSDPKGRWIVTWDGTGPIRMTDLEAKDPVAATFARDVRRAPRPARPIPEHWSKQAGQAPFGDEEDGASGLILTFSPDGRWLAAADPLGDEVSVWALRPEGPAAKPIVLKGQGGLIAALAFHPTGRWLVTAAGRATRPADMFRSWDLEAKDPATSNSPLLARAAKSGGNIRLVRLNDRQKSEDTGPVPLALAFEPDGLNLVAWSEQTRWLWNWGEQGPGARQALSTGLCNFPTPLAFSPDGRWLLAPEKGENARLDLLGDEQTQFPLPGQAGFAALAEFSRDGRWLATTGNDETARLWDLNEVARPRSQEDPAPMSRIFPGVTRTGRILRFDPDQRRLVTVGTGRTLQLWTLKTDDLLKTAERTAGRNLTRAEWSQYFPGQEYRKTFDDLPAPPAEPLH